MSPRYEILAPSAAGYNWWVVDNHRSQVIVRSCKTKEEAELALMQLEPRDLFGHPLNEEADT